MMEDMKSKLMQLVKKKGRKVSDNEGDALKSVLEDLMGQASEAMADKVKGHMGKVSVMADSKKGLEKGLDKAKDVVEGMPKDEEESDESEDSEGSDESESEEKDEESKIKELEEMVKDLKAQLDSKRMI